MKKTSYFIIISIMLCACSNHRTTLNGISFRKLWKFKKYQVVNINPNGSVDFGTKDTLQFLDLSVEGKMKFIGKGKSPEVIGYKQLDSSLVIKDNITFKIYKLTNNNLTLVVQSGKQLDNLPAMVFEAE